MRRRFETPAGERTVVVDRRSGSIPRDYVLEIVSPTGDSVGGIVEIQGSRWLARKDPEVHKALVEFREAQSASVPERPY